MVEEILSICCLVPGDMPGLPREEILTSHLWTPDFIEASLHFAVLVELVGFIDRTDGSVILLC